MKYFLNYSLFTILIAIFIAGCSELGKNVPTSAPEVSVHKSGILNENSPDFHGNLIKNSNWSMKECKKCHAANYTGGVTGQSCFQCHTQQEGPEACNTCHGDFNKPLIIAPPRDTNGNTFTTNRNVGAHTSHLYADSLTNNVTCAACHNVPATLEQQGHIDNTPNAELNFTGLSINNIATSATYNANTLTCSNTYCHGNFEFKKADADPEYQFAYSADKIVGANFSPKWTKVDGTQAKCGSCHGLPPTGHIDVPITSCFYCHQGIVDADGKIIDKDKHINGYKSVRGSLNKMQEFLKSIK
ncbi:MAG TPA: CxxxxCH/CxxCH domain-containing protein [Ignavibacteriaceae bacterium]|nr:CxxxxCH/CxxCH domain-containing protein [Ignavibacteriaceae bacterium]